MAEIIAPKLTGKIMFQFDDGKPIEITKIFDYGKFIIELQQNEKKDIGTFQKANCVQIEFRSEMKEKFRLYIEDCL